MVLKLKVVSSKKFFGIIIDDQLTFKSHIWNILKKASQKFNALTRIASYMDQKKRKTSSILSLICNLVIAPWYRWWMHSRKMNKKK